MTDAGDARSIVERSAGLLHRAWQTTSPIPPLSETDADLTVRDAYDIQNELVQLIRRADSSVTGYKLGLTSRPMQEMFGVSSPDYSAVLSDFVHDHATVFRLEDFIAPRVEAEIAFLLKAPLRGPGVTAAHASHAVAGAIAAIEVVDSRIADWRIKIVDTIADLASCGGIVLGSRIVPLGDWDPRYVGVAVRRNGFVEATGAGAAALGDPLRALAWLANTLAGHGVTLEASQVILTGSLHRALELDVGDRVRADFDRLGSISCSFT